MQTKLTEEFVNAMKMKQSDHYVLWISMPEKNYASIERSEISVLFVTLCAGAFTIIVFQRNSFAN